MGFFADVANEFKDFCITMAEVCHPELKDEEIPELTEEEKKKNREENKRLATCPFCGYYSPDNFDRWIDDIDQLAQVPRIRSKRRYVCGECNKSWGSKWSEYKRL